MKCTANSGRLKVELSLLQKIVERKNTIPILGNVLLEAKASDTTGVVSKLTMRGTDLDTTLLTEVDATVAQSGSVCVSARKLLEIIKLIKEEDEVDLTLDKANEGRLKIESHKAKWALPVAQTEAFPERPTLSIARLTLPALRFSEWIDRTRFAITKEEGRYTLAGAKLELKSDGTAFVTTDGHRLALIRDASVKARSADHEFDDLVPARALDALRAIIHTVDDENATIRIGKTENHIFFQSDARILVARMMAGQFPNYEMVLPKGNDNSFSLDTADLILAVKRAALTADDRSRSIRFGIRNNALTVTGDSAEAGHGQDELEIEYTGDDAEIGFNATYVQDFLDSVGTERVLFLFKDGNTQALFQPVDEKFEYLMVIMPMRL